MRSVKRIRHYCDHCSKSSGRRDAMVRHELGCTANPSRTCNMCAWAGLAQPSLAEMRINLGDGLDDQFKNLTKFVSGCPACILTAIRDFNKRAVDRHCLDSWNKIALINDWEFPPARDAFFIEYADTDAGSGYY